MSNNKYATSEDAINNLVGRILTLVDTLNLPEKQEKAFKDQIKQLIWGMEKVWLPKDITARVEQIQVTFSPAEKIKSNKELGYD